MPADDQAKLLQLLTLLDQTRAEVRDLSAYTDNANIHGVVIQLGERLTEMQAILEGCIEHLRGSK